jgi:hypothetical protein
VSVRAKDESERKEKKIDSPANPRPQRSKHRLLFQLARERDGQQQSTTTTGGAAVRRKEIEPQKQPFFPRLFFLSVEFSSQSTMGADAELSIAPRKRAIERG